MLRATSESTRTALTASTEFNEALFSWMIDQIEGIVDEEKVVSHSAIASELNVILSREITTVSDKHSLRVEEFSLWDNPCIQSGVFDISNTANTMDPLQHNIVSVDIGTKVSSVPVRCRRTLLIDPQKDQERQYLLLLDCHKILVNALKVGVALGDVYDKVYRHVSTKFESFTANLLPDFGACLGPDEMSDKKIAKDEERTVEAGEIYYICIGFKDLTSAAWVIKLYSLLIGDTVLIKDSGESMILTQSNRRYQDISYVLESGSADETQAEGAGIDLANVGEGSVIRSSRLRNKAENRVKEDDSKRKLHQMELLELKNKDLRKRFLGGELKTTSDPKAQRYMDEISAYPSTDTYPDALKNGQLYVDPRHEALLVPLNGIHVPFHISTIKNAAKTDEGKFSYLRINFFHPGSGMFNRDSTYILPELKNDDNYFVRELTFRSTDTKLFAAIFRQLKELTKRVRTKDQESLARRDLVDQERLIIIKGKRPILPELTLRPTISGKKTMGALEAHQNGLRFMSSKGEKIDIIYSNVKHAIFQPVESEIIVLLHFHLFNPILIGSRKATDLQFFSEAGVATDDLDSRRRLGQDIDEIHQEYREKKYREKLNREFNNFVKSIQAISGDIIEFDMPYRELGFFGVPNKGNQLIMPTVNCLVSLIENPFFIITLDDIEIAHFERVQFNLKNFDLCFVFKDYSRAPVRISTISTHYLEPIRDWLDDINIVFSESANPLKWVNVIKEINKDIEGFIEDGGWGFLQDNADSDEEGGSEQENVAPEEVDSDFNEEDVGDSDSSRSESGTGSDGEEESSDFEESEDSEGLDWDDLEKIAKNADSKSRDYEKKRTITN